ncbi:hydroxyisourate hydrolase [Nocardia australiensis]|uniref:hydroxyisourate hydrolase n=1 Tax=Nocardia australiensis TaxID=2887191 RepID=UPI001D15BB20|nr:hydroxyisourate hydrolase [Nocardia australiensis]
MSTLSTHVLDAVRGAPATGIAVALHGGGPEELDSGVTATDGRIGALGAELVAGTYRLVFDTGAYFAGLRIESFYPEISITFIVTEDRHYHIPLLLSPFAFSTYRGS